MLAINCLKAQTARRDSLIALLPSAKNDSTKAMLLYHIGDEYEANDDVTATTYYNKAFELSKQLHFNRGIIRYYSCQGEILNNKGKYAECMAMLRSGYAFAIYIKDIMREGVMCENMGNTFAFMEKLDSATGYYFRALKIFERLNDSVKMAIVYADLSNILMRTDKLDKAMLYVNKGIAVTRVKKDEFYLAALASKEALLWKLKRYDEARQTIDELIILARQQNNYWSLYTAYADLCSHSRDLHNYSGLSDYAKQLLEINKEINSRVALCEAYYWNAEAAFYNKQFNEASSFAERAIGIAEKDSLTKQVKECYRLYSNILIAKGLLPLAYDYGGKADSIDELTLNKNILTATQESQAAYETEKKDAEILKQKARLQQERTWKAVLAGLLLVLVVIGFISLRLYRNRQALLVKEKELQQQKIIQLESESQLAASQSVLKGQEEERERLAKDLHDGLGGILSGVKYSFSNMKQQFVLNEESVKAFEKSMAMLDESMSELRRIAHNMMPESLVKLSLNDALRDYCMYVTKNSTVVFDYQGIGLDDMDPENTIKTSIYRIVQELVNNILKHAGAANALVQIIWREGVIYITVEDNGTGFNTADLTMANGIGFKNTSSRVNYLKGKMDVQSVPGQGTSVHIEVPFAAITGDV